MQTKTRTKDFTDGFIFTLYSTTIAALQDKAAMILSWEKWLERKDSKIGDHHITLMSIPEKIKKHVHCMIMKSNTLKNRT